MDIRTPSIPRRNTPRTALHYRIMPSRQQTHLLLLALMLLALTVLFGNVTAQPGVEDCPVFVEQAMTELEDQCGDMARNAACYGYYRVSAEFSEAVDDTVFSQPSDRVELTTLSSIATAPLDAETGQWGIAVLSVQANVPNSLPGQAVKFILMGDAELHNAVTSDTALTPVDPVSLALSDQANLRSGPSDTANVLATVEADVILEADGISADGDWLRVFYERANMWISQRVIEPVSVSELPVIDETSYTPMQAFYFTTGVGQPACNEAPDMLVVQGPDEVLVDLSVNGADITVGSTAVFRSGAGSVDEILGNADLPDDVRERLESAEAGQDELCGLVQIMVVSGEVDLNQGTVTLPEGYSAFSVACDLDDDDGPTVEPPDDGQPPVPAAPEIFVTDWTVPVPLDEDNLADLTPLETLPERITNYVIQIPTLEQIAAGPPPRFDSDSDRVPDPSDNCPDVPNTRQKDSDGDGVGDACDEDTPPDKDRDGVPDDVDNCPDVENNGQADRDGDGVGNHCDPDFRPDADGDHVPDNLDNCPDTANTGQRDADRDGQGNACDDDDDNDGFADDVDDCSTDAGTSTQGRQGCPDNDGDGWANGRDNCPLTANGDQADVDGDGIGDACADLDADSDGFLNDEDDCPARAGTSTEGRKGCPDDDGDGWANSQDNCPDVPNAGQAEHDGDGIGDKCDDDVDGDGFANANDNCPITPGSSTSGELGCADSDGDGWSDNTDNCPDVANAGQAEHDGDGIGDKCDDDVDGDGFANNSDNCPITPGSSTQGELGCVDSDGDGWSDGTDNCPSTANNGQADHDGDGIGTACDGDVDGDGFPNGGDNCPATPGSSTSGEAGCPDSDGDGWSDGTDNCPSTPNSGQADHDGDGIGSLCDGDVDGDGVPNGSDGCPATPGTSTLGQAGCPDSDGDGWSDGTDGCPADPGKSAAGICGCGVADTNTDGDGLADCQDTCPGAWAVEANGCPLCPNGTTEAGETCDDGNTTPGDGCDASCQTE